MENELKFEMKRHPDLNFYYISDGSSNYLWGNGTLKSSTGFFDAGSSHEKAPGWFNSREEAQQFLNGWNPRGAWLHKNFIKYKAKQGDKEALDCSIEHWKQIVLAGWDKYCEARDKNKVRRDGDYCALCKRRAIIGRVCSEACPLKCCGISTTWDKAYGATAENFTERTINMLNHLVEIRNKLYGNPYLVEEKKMAAELQSNSTGGKAAAKEMTVREIGEKLGYDVKVVKEEVKKEPEHVFVAGDIVTTYGEKRLVVKIDDKLYAVKSDGFLGGRNMEDNFESCGYKYLGKAKDFSIE